MIDKLRLDELCTPKSSNLAQKDIQENDGDYPVYGAGGFIKNINFYHQESDYIAVVKDGAGIGRAMFLPAKSSIIGTMQYLIPKNNVDPKYLYYAVKGMNLSKYYSGATIPHIYFKDYKKESVPLYSKDQQKMISRSLEKVEELIIKKQQLLNEYDQLIKSRFVEMFGDPITNNKGWDVKDLNEITDVRDGTHDSPKYVDIGYPFVTSKNLVNGNIDFSTCQLISKDDLEKINQRSFVDDGDILMPMIGTIGGAIIVKKDRDFAIKNVALIKFNKENSIVDRKFILNVLNSDSMNEFFNSIKKGGTQNFISLGLIRKIPTIIPPLKLQNEFALFVEQVDKLKFENEILYSIYRFTINKQTKLLSYRGVTL